MVVWLVPKVTFTLDDDTVETIRTLSGRRRKPLSQIVREAVAAYAQREETLSEEERARRLHAIDQLMAGPQTRPAAEVDAELADIRRTRRSGWRRPGE